MSKIYTFKKKVLEQKALLHPSKKPNVEFQRLEFLGDRVLSFEIAKILFRNQHLNEGDMSVKLSELVKKSTQAQVGQFLISKIQYSGELNDSVLSDCLEAWIGAVFLDKAPISEIIEKLWSKFLGFNYDKNEKNILQEIMQRKKIPLIYEYSKNNREFVVKVKINNLEIEAQGISKKQASQLVARKILNLINQDSIIFFE